MASLLNKEDNVQEKRAEEKLINQIKELSPVVYSSISFNKKINKSYLHSWLKIKKQKPSNDININLQNVIKLVNQSKKKKNLANAIIKLGKQKFTAYKEERSKANKMVEIIAPISASPDSVVKAGLQLLLPKSHDILCDLGCGDGRWLIEAAKNFGCRCMGVEIEEDRLEIGRAEVSKLGLDHLVDLRNGDIFQTDLSTCTMVVCYLFGESTGKVRRKVLRNLRTGSLVLSVSFQFRDGAKESGDEKQEEMEILEKGKREEGEGENETMSEIVNETTGHLELLKTLDQGVERKLLLYRWIKS